MELLLEGCKLLGISLSEDQVRLFRLYADELVRWNRQVNLTAITGYEDIQTKHFLDSLSCLIAFPDVEHQKYPPYIARMPSLNGLRLIDVGAGAGFPGIPLKIIDPTVELTLLEAVGKKARFLEYVVQSLGLVDVQVVVGRAEEVGHNLQHRESYDVVVSRAVAELAVLSELCLPLARVGGRLIAPKKGTLEDEIQSAQRAVSILGGLLGQPVDVELHGFLDLRYLIVVDKVAPTPASYPRRPGIPAKRPLGQKT